jgi:hypothetical protein
LDFLADLIKYQAQKIKQIKHKDAGTGLGCIKYAKYAKMPRMAHSTPKISI